VALVRESASPQVVDFDPGALRAAFAAAGRHLVEVTAGLGPGRWDEPALGVWRLRDLVGHAGRALRTVVAYRDAGEGRTVELGHAFDYAAVFRSAHADPAAIAERARVAGAELGGDPAAALGDLLAEVTSVVAARPDDTPVATPAGVMRLVDYLPSRIFELVVHTEDIGAATGRCPTPPADAAAVAISFAAGIAAGSADARTVLFALTGRGGLDAGFTIL
jgi:uncharacterized protein (TIGR03083 family)